MKKVIALFGVMLFSAAAFALNAVAPEDENCQAQKEKFEQTAARLDNDSFIVQNILLNLADPMEKLPDAQAMPFAACYATFRVKGQPLAKFVRDHADMFRQKAGFEEGQGIAFDKIQGQLLDFAERVERLGAQAQINRVAENGNESFIMQYILYNFADPMVNMSDEEATPLAKAYKQCKVKGKPMLQYVNAHSGYLNGNVKEDYDVFVNRVTKLAE